MNRVKFLPAVLLIMMFSGANTSVSAADNCKLDLPNPVLEFKGTEDYEANGQQWTRYRLNVTNRNHFPKELFRQAPDLPPCGLNENASRTWVDILESGERIYGFCALSSADNLGDIWFAKRRGEKPPQPVHIQLRDRSCDATYTSNRVGFDNPVVNVNCDEGESLNQAIAAVAPNGTVNVQGTCKETQPIVIPKSKNRINLIGPKSGGFAVIDGGGQNRPVLTLDGANQVTLKNLKLVNGETGVLFTNQAGGKLINVVASDNTHGFVVAQKSYVKMDDVNASHNRSHGIKVLDGSHVRFMNLEPSEDQCRNHEVKQSALFKMPLLVSRATASTPTYSCNVIANGNGNDGLLVNGSCTTNDKSCDYTKLDIENCFLELSQNGGNGLNTQSGGKVTGRGSTLKIESNKSDGINISEASTLAFYSFPGEIQSNIEINSNLYGIALIGSSLNLYDTTNIQISNNTEYGIYADFFQSLTCAAGQSKINLFNNGHGNSILYQPGTNSVDGQCIQ